jgi:hypothetical protein
LYLDFEASSSSHEEILRLRTQPSPIARVDFGPGEALGNSGRIIYAHAGLTWNPLLDGQIVPHLALLDALVEKLNDGVHVNERRARVIRRYTEAIPSRPSQPGQAVFVPSVLQASRA